MTSPPLQPNRKILVIDDNQAIHQDFVKILSRRQQDDDLDKAAVAFLGGTTQEEAKPNVDFTVDSAHQGQEGWEMVVAAQEAGEPYAVAFVDMRMPPGWDGVKTIEEIFKSDPDIQIVICSAYSDYSWNDLLQRFGVTDRLLILRKPFDTAEVLQITSSLSQKYTLGEQAKVHRDMLEQLVDERTAELKEESNERERAVVALTESEKRFRSAFDDAGVGMAMIEGGQKLTRVNRALCTMLGYTEQEVCDLSLDALVDPGTLEQDRYCRTEFMDSADKACQYETRYGDKAGNTVWVNLTLSKIDEDESGQCQLLAQVQDITDRKQAEDRLRYEAMHDTLTGLANRALFTDRLRRALERTRRESDFTAAVMFVDLDRFKIINDSLGHLVGDELLIKVTERISSCLRRLDTVATHQEQTLARVGGDEFVILLENIKSVDAAETVADRIQTVLGEVFPIQGFEVFVSASLGINMVSPEYANTDEVLRDADTALYRAKGAGRAQACVFDPTMHETAKKRLDTEVNLRHAIDRGELRLVYQPIVSLATRQITGFEALLRWQREDGRLVMPNDFIQVAEETGQIVKIGAWALQTACEQIRDWRAQFPYAKDLAVSVNTSGIQLTREDLPGTVYDAIDASGCDYSAVNLEITESVIGTADEMAYQRLNELRQRGVGIHLDDFGTGYSSMAYLRALPVDVLKIDRSFVNRLPNSEPDRAIVEAVVTLAHKLDMRVVAEGVESCQELQQVDNLECDLLQGYLFAKPLSVEDAAELIQSQRVWSDEYLGMGEPLRRSA